MAEAAGLATEGQITAADRAGDALAQLEAAAARGFQIGIVEAFASSVDDSVDALHQASDAGKKLGQVVGVAMRGLAAAAQLVAKYFAEISAAIALFVSYRIATVALQAAGAFIRFAAAVRTSGRRSRSSIF